MTQQKPSLSQVVPVLVAAVVCDTAVTDPSTGKNNLIGIFDKVHVGKFPTKRPMSVYFKLTNAEGYYEILVRYVELKSDTIFAEALGELHAHDRLVSSDLHIAFPPLPINKEGRYEFQIWANSMFLGRTFIDAVQRTQA